MGFENGKVLRVVLQATAGDVQQVNTFHYDCIDDFGQPANDPQSLADFFRDNVRPGFAAHYNSGWTIQPVQVVQEKDPQNPTAPRQSWTSGAAIAGTATPSSDLLPRFCTILVHLKTAHIGRRFRGRLWIGGSRSEGEQATGQWTAGMLAGEQTFADNIPRQPDIQSGQSTSTCKWSVYSRTQRAQNLDPYLSEITSATVDAFVHSLRNRAQY